MSSNIHKKECKMCALNQLMLTPLISPNLRCFILKSKHCITIYNKANMQGTHVHTLCDQCNTAWVSFTFFFTWINVNKKFQEMTTYFTVAMIKSKSFCLSGRCVALHIQNQNAFSLSTAGLYFFVWVCASNLILIGQLIWSSADWGEVLR